MRCSNGLYYVVKFQNNPRGVRTLANGLFGSLLAKRLGLPVADSAVIWVDEALIGLSTELNGGIGTKSKFPRRQSGLSLGSRYPATDDENGVAICSTVFDLLPVETLRNLRNLSDFRGMLVFDKWTCNSDDRQAVFVRNPDDGSYSAKMIDQGMCFNGQEWDFRDCVSLGLYYPSAVYESVTSVDAFEPWLCRLEHVFDATILEELAHEIPPEWYGGDAAALGKLINVLDRRRTMVRDLLWDTWKRSPKTFPGWVERRHAVCA